MNKTFKLFTAIYLSFSFGAMMSVAAEVETPTVYGFMAYADEWRDVEPADERYGYYSFRADGSTAFTAVSSISPDNAWAIDAGTLADGKFYGYSVPTNDSWSSYRLQFFVVDTETWSVSYSNSFSYKYGEENAAAGDAYLIPSDLAYDPINGIIYAAARRYQSQLESRLCTVDPETGRLTRLGEIPPMAAITTNSLGELFGVGIDGNLYSIAPEGKATMIGATGFFPSDGLKQSATCDYRTDKIYWSAMAFPTLKDFQYNTNSIFGMIEIEPETASSQVIWSYPRDQRFTSVSIPNPHPLSPSDITDLSFTPTSFEALEGVITCTAPDKTATLVPITGDITIRCYVDNQLVNTASVSPGGSYSHTVANLSEGSHAVAVEAEYNGYTGNRAYANTYFGFDLPARIAKVSLVRDPEDFTKATLTWEAPVTGEHGTAYDGSKIRYHVVRYPDEAVVKRSMSETTCTDVVTNPYGRFFYAVTPYNVDRPSELGQTTTSNGEMLGSDIIPPYRETFDTRSAFQNFTVIDVDGNGDPDVWGTPTWMYDETYACAFYYGVSGYPADDYLVTPPFDLNPDRLYRLSYKYYGYYGYGNHFQVTIGSEATAESQSRILQDIEKVTYSTDMPGIDESVVFAPRNGDRFIAFHHISTNQEHLSIDNIVLEDMGDSRIPDMATNLNGTKLSSESLMLTFNAPVVNAAGEQLEENLTIKIYHDLNQQPIATMTGIKPGEKVEWTDENAVKGFNAYVVVAENSFGAGLSVSITVDLSDALPVSIETALVSYVNDRQVVINWEPVTSSTGTNGSELDTDEIRYLVYKPVATEDGVDYHLIGRDLTDCHFVDDEPLKWLSDEQQVVAYYLAPVNGAGEGVAMLTNGVIVGPSYPLPFKETWYQQTQETNPWSKIFSNQAGWYIRHKGYDPMCDGQDGYGLLTCELDGYEGLYSEGTGAIMTPRLDLSSMTDPKLSFWYYRDPCYDQSVMMRVAMLNEGATSYEYFPTTYYANSATAGWEEVTIDLSKYASETRISVVLMAHVVAGNHFHVDNFRIDGAAKATHVRPEYITGPTDRRVNEPRTLGATVRNLSDKDATNVKVDLMIGNETIASKTIEKVGAGETAQALFDFTPEARHAGETTVSIMVNGRMEKATKQLNVRQWNPAAVTRLKAATTTGGVALSWNVPTLTPDLETTSDNFDLYDTFTIDDAGDWQFVDLDGLVPFRFSNGAGSTLQWTNNDVPQAFMVFDPSQLTSAPSAVSGNNYLVNWGSPYGKNNDWLISPLLDGGKQLISFYARAFASGKEEFNMMVSRSDNDPDNFLPLNGGEPMVASADWQLYHFALPEGTRYFAINYVGDRQDGIIIDDIMFTGYHNAMKPDGYNVYRDGKKLNSSLVASREYVDSDVALDETHTYVVRAVYNGRESEDSNEALSGEASLESVSTGEAGKITVAGNLISVAGAEGAVVEVYRPDGILQYSATATSEPLDIELPTGVYIVKVGTKAAKVALR